MSVSSEFPELLLEQEDGSEFSGFDGDSSHDSKKAEENEQTAPTKSVPPKKELASEETVQVRRVRCLLVGVILLGIAVSLGTYFFVNHEAENDYEISFDLFANAIQDSLENSAEDLHAALRNLAESISDSRKADSQDDGQGNFPFVLVDLFETHGEHALDRSKMEAILFAPLVSASMRQDWEVFSFEHQDWIQESRAKFLDHLDPGKNPPVYIEGNISPYVYRRRENIFPEASDANMSAPIWYLSPPPFNPAIVNFDMLSNEMYRETLLYAIKTGKPVFSPVLDVEQFSSMQLADADHYDLHQQFTTLAPGSIGYDHPHSIYVRPVFASTKSNQVVGILMGAVAWDAYLANLLPTGVKGVHAILRIQCSESQDESYSYELNGPVPTFLGKGDLHSRRYSKLVRSILLFSENNADQADKDRSGTVGDACSYLVDLYPSQTFKEQYDSNSALVAACSLGGTFLVVALVFFGYDYVVNKRNQKVTAAAEKSNAIVSSLFPENVRERLYQEKETNQGKHSRRNSSDSIDEASLLQASTDRPIAELFPESTILFADIQGFTSWSSAREPAQVFVLLENIYSAFDSHAKRRNVYKIETIGDCYVAVCGVPEPNKNHAVVMTRFARDCLRTFAVLVQELEATLGPDTSDLQLRVGLHSGAVTGGVLRGERARFQLFGDSMNTASRMESNGVGGKIHCSQATADLLIEAGKAAWLRKREDKIVAKGKGEMTTYWVSINSKAESSNESESHHSDRTDESVCLAFDDRTERWIDYNVATLEPVLKRIVFCRGSSDSDVSKAVPAFSTSDTAPVDENRAIIEFPEAAHVEDETSGELGDCVTAQLKAFVGSIASMYREEIPFHNFEHATSVVMSASKLLAASRCSQRLDPLTQFAVIISALIHDVDHQGVGNAQLAKEDPSMRTFYKGRCLAEQNSFDLSWKMLMQDEFRELLRTICNTEDELKHLRQVMVNAVLATDLFDNELNSFRSVQWENAFGEENDGMAPVEQFNRKATAIIGLLMQVSDVSHCLQHFHIYRKWNTRLFCEMTMAYRAGRLSLDPASFWYEGELQFFDKYVLPMAQKLKDCGVFGATAAEYFDYALENRREWERKGHAIIEEMKVLSQTELCTNLLNIDLEKLPEQAGKTYQRS